MSDDKVSALLAGDHAGVDVLFSEALRALDAEDAATAFQLVDFLWARLAVHIRAENLALFPAILRALNHGAENAPRTEEAQCAISELRADHDFFMRELAGVVNQMRPHLLNSADPLTPQQFSIIRKSVEAVRERLETHNRLEEEKVYTWPDLLLGTEEYRYLVNELKLQIENLPPRFNTSLDAGRAR